MISVVRYSIPSATHQRDGRHEMTTGNPRISAYYLSPTGLAAIAAARKHLADLRIARDVTRALMARLALPVGFVSEVSA